MTIDRRSKRGVAVPLIAVLVLVAALGAWLVPARVSLADPVVPTPTLSPAPSPPSVADRIDAGDDHTCLVDDDKAVRCWGRNDVGQLGHGDNATVSKIDIGDNETPASAGTVYLDDTDASRVSVGANHSCAILVDAKVACWGHNLNGALGSGQDWATLIGDDEVPGATRVDLGLNRTAKAIAAGGDHTCVITDRDKVMCWGNGAFGQLGYGNENDIGDDIGEVPAGAGTVDLGNGRSARSIAAGRSHTCALMDNGNVFCWGSNAAGQLGYPNIDNVGDTERPVDVGTVDLGAMKATRLTAGDSHTCAELDNGKLRCWGSDQFGAIGSGPTGNPGLPPDTGHVDLRAIGEPARDVIQAGVGTTHTCAVLSGIVRDVRCWGSGGGGKLGLVQGTTTIYNVGDDESPASFPIVDLAGASIVAITGGDWHTCAVTDTGRVRCWGDNDHGAVGHPAGSPVVGDDEAPGAIGPINLGATITCTRVSGMCAS